MKKAWFVILKTGKIAEIPMTDSLAVFFDEQQAIEYHETCSWQPEFKGSKIVPGSVSVKLK